MKALEQIVVLDPDQTFACKEYRMRKFPSPYHSHEEVEITAIVNSYGSLHVGKEVFPFDAGQVFLLGSSLPHMFYSGPLGSNAPDWAHSIVLQFRKDCLGNEFLNLPEMADLHSLFNDSLKGVLYEGGAAVKLQELLSELLNATGLLRVRLLIDILYVLLNSKQKNHLLSATPSLEVSSTYAERIESITQYVHQHMGERISLDELAQHVHMNATALSRFFRQATGRKLSRYIAQIRIYEACRLLRHGKAPITHIALECGFENLSSFNRNFRVITGTTPKDYRNNRALVLEN